MGLTYCKSLCSSSKTQHSVNGSALPYSQTVASQEATAADYNLSTIQNALEQATSTEGNSLAYAQYDQDNKFY